MNIGALERIALVIFRRLGRWLHARDQRRLDASDPCYIVFDLDGRDCDRNFAGCPLCGGPWW